VLDLNLLLLKVSTTTRPKKKVAGRGLDETLTRFGKRGAEKGKRSSRLQGTKQVRLTGGGEEVGQKRGGERWGVGSERGVFRASLFRE